MATVEYLDREYELLGWQKDEMYNALKKICEVFDGQGHSGFSAAYAIGTLERLLRYEPLGPLTGEDDEWNEVGPSTLQNKRCSHVFKENGQAYDIRGKIFKDERGHFTSGDSRVDIEFPVRSAHSSTCYRLNRRLKRYQTT